MFNHKNYRKFTRPQWANLAKSAELSLDVQELKSLHGVYDQVSLLEVKQIYLPLVEFLNYQIDSYFQLLQRVEQNFLQQSSLTRKPFIIGIAGSVAVGKSTFSRLLQNLLTNWLTKRQVALVTTDGFLYSNTQLEKKNLFDKKGFPASYDATAMIDFLTAAKLGRQVLKHPVYSHELYDIDVNKQVCLALPEVLIVEGLNVLQAVPNVSSMTADFFDFTIYLDAAEQDIQRWYIERFLQLQKTVFANPKSFFNHFKDLSQTEAIALATQVWQDINLVNLRENIEPSKSRAKMLIKKNQRHQIDEIWLRNF